MKMSSCRLQTPRARFVYVVHYMTCVKCKGAFDWSKRKILLVYSSKCSDIIFFSAAYRSADNREIWHQVYSTPDGVSHRVFPSLARCLLFIILACII